MTDHWERSAHAALVQSRIRAMTVPCSCCGARQDEPCRSPKTGAELGKLPAHNVRVQDAQAAP